MSFRIERNGVIPSQISPSKNTKINGSSFEDVLKDTISKKQDIKISSHAEKRMLERVCHGN